MSFNHNRLIGDPKLKKFKSGLMFQSQPCTELDYKIFYLFVSGISIEKIQTTLEKDKKSYKSIEIYHIIRQVGMELQTFYRKVISQPCNINELIFSDFIRGMEITELCDSNHISTIMLITILRKVGLLYYTHKKHNKT